MAYFYAQCAGSNARTNGTRTGARSVSASVQSYTGSLISELRRGDDGADVLTLYINSDSAFYGREIFSGSLAELCERLGA